MFKRSLFFVFSISSALVLLEPALLTPQGIKETPTQTVTPPSGAPTITVVPSIPPLFRRVANIGGTLYGYGPELLSESKDKGSSWQIVAVRPNQIAVDNERILARVGSDLYVSTNFGSTWLLTKSSDWAFLGKRNVYAFDDQGLKYSTNLGRTWTDIANPPDLNLSNIVDLFEFDDGLMIIEREDKDTHVKFSAIGTKDFGATWQDRGFITTADSNSENFFINSGNRLFSYVSGQFWAEQPGSSWRKVEAATLRPLLSDSSLDGLVAWNDNLYCLIGFDIYESSNGGSKWTRVAETGNVLALGLDTEGPIALTKIGDSQSLLRIGLGQNTFIETPKPPIGVSFIADPSGELFCGATACFLRKGSKQQWSELSGILPGSLHTIVGLKDRIVGAFSSGFYLSAGGSSWTESNLHSSSRWEIASNGETTIVACRSREERRTVDGGQHWNISKATPGTGTCIGVIGDDGLFYKLLRDGTNLVLMKSEDAGDSWTQVGSLGDLKSTQLQFVLTKTHSLFLKNAQAMFRISPNGVITNITGLIKVDSSVNLAVSPNGSLVANSRSGVWWSSNEGDSWQFVSPPPETTNPNARRDFVRHLFAIGPFLTTIGDDTFLIGEANLFPNPTFRSYYLKLPSVSSEIESSSYLADIFNVAGSFSDPIVTLDGQPDSGLLMSRSGEEIRLRGTDSLSNKLSDGAHSIAVTVQKAQESFTVKSYVWRDSAQQWFKVNPYNRSYAIVAAISTYGNGLPDLPDAEQQGRLVEAALKQQGFEVKSFWGGAATRDNIERYLLKDLKPKLAKGDRLVVYFGGHGVTVPDYHNELVGYLMTANVTKSAPELGLPMSRLEMEYSKILGAGQILFVVDACFSGLVGTRDTPNDAAQRFSRYVQMKLLLNQGLRASLVAGRAQDKAVDVNGGIFTKAFISGINGAADLDNNGVVSTYELYLYIKKRVSEEAIRLGFEQVPQLSIVPSGGQGEMLFFYR